MKRGWFAVLGGVMLVAFGAVTAVFGTAFWSAPVRAMQGVLLLGGGAAFVWGGRGEERYELEPIRLIGLGTLALGNIALLNGLAVLVGGLPSATAELVAAVGATVSGFALAFIGGGLYRGGDEIEITISDDPIFGDR